MHTSGRWVSLLIGSLCLVLGSARARGQETAAPAPAVQRSPAPDVAEPPPYSLDLPELHPPANGTGLFPNGPRQNPPPPGAGASGRNHRELLKTGAKQHGRSLDRTLQKADADPLAIRIAYRRDKTTVLARDPGLLELLRSADAVRSDAAKRARLRQYYTRLFASIRQIDSSPAMQAHLALLTEVAGQRYDPSRRAVYGEEDLLETRETNGRSRLGR